MKEIPEIFYKKRKHPKARTVADLKKILDMLPDELRIEMGSGGGPCEVIVYNHRTTEVFLDFKEAW